jgi:hypothetical protein
MKTVNSMSVIEKNGKLGFFDSEGFQKPCILGLLIPKISEKWQP